MLLRRQLWARCTTFSGQFAVYQARVSTGACCETHVDQRHIAPRLIALQEGRKVGDGARRHVHGGVAGAGDGVDAQVLDVGAADHALRAAEAYMQGFALRGLGLIIHLGLARYKTHARV